MRDFDGLRAIPMEELEAKMRREAPLARQRGPLTEREMIAMTNAGAYSMGNGALVEVKAPPPPPSRLRRWLSDRWLHFTRWWDGIEPR